MKPVGRPDLWMRGAYFTFYAGIACWAPYIVLYYQARGLRGAEIGVLTALVPLGMALLAPVWGYVADAWRVHRLILQLALLTTAAVVMLLTQVNHFWQILPLILLYALLGTSVSPLLDSYGVIISTQRGLGFGQLRVWGSISYTLVVWLIGVAMGSTVSGLFLVCYALTLVLTCAASAGLPAQRQGATRPRWQGAAALLRRPDLRIVLLVVMLLAISTTPVFVLFGIYLERLGGDTALLGRASAIAALSELPVLFWGSRLTARFGSRRILIIALSIYSLRILLYALIDSAPWVLIVQLLHGCSFGLYLIASVGLVHELVGDDLVATAQGLLASAMAAGQMTGSLASGILLDQIGIVAIYRLSVGITLTALLIFVLSSMRVKHTST